MDAARLKRIQEISERAQDYSRVEIVEALCDLLAEMPRWISVEERLPKNNSYVVAAVPFTDATTKETAVEVLPCLFDENFLGVDGNDYDAEVTHWMPLPAAPEGETK